VLSDQVSQDDTSVCEKEAVHSALQASVIDRVRSYLRPVIIGLEGLAAHDIIILAVEHLTT
jgi:hypothetical protein